MNIVFRVDSNKTIGAGHSMRCISLAEEFLRQKHNVFFISNSQLEFIKNILVEKKILTIKIHSSSEASECNMVLNLLKQYKTDFIVLDGYGFGLDYQKKLRKEGFKLCLITDYRTQHSADILVCHTPGLTGNDFISKTKTDYFLGPRYVFLRDEILGLKRSKKPSEPLRILLNFGAGVSDLNALKKITEYIERLYAGGLIKVLVGSNKITKRFVTYFENKKNKYQLISPAEFNTHVLRDSDLAFSAAGTTVWDLLYLRIPVVCFYTSENQRGNAEWLGKNKYCFNLGNITKLNFDTVNPLKQILSNPSKLFDGQGKKHVVKKILTKTHV